MKTYKRKRHEHQELEGVLERCRLCLTEVEEGYPIYRDSKDVCAAVAMRIMICVGLEMSYVDSLPNMICTNCYEELEKYYKFRKKCEASYHKLKLHLLALKDKEHKYITLEQPDRIKEDISEQPEQLIKYSDFKEESSDQNQSVPANLNSNECAEKCNELAEKSLEDKQLLKDNSHLDLVVEVPKQLEEQVAKVDLSDGIATEKAEEIEEVQIPMHSEPNQNIGTFLTSILTELGILAMQDNELVLQDQGITSFELETGNNEHLVLELVEEDDNGEPGMMEIVDVERDTPQQAVHTSEEKVVYIDARPKQNKRKTVKPAGPWCNVCGRTFSSVGAAARHARVHSAARPHACRVCAATFKQKAVRDRHALTHLAVRPYSCASCDKSFTQRAALAAHARSHAAPPARRLALHRCAACHKVFLYASGLSRHMKTHTGRVYECSACDKQFRDRSSLQRHLKNFHKNSTSES